MSLNKDLKAFIGHGYFDLVTPYFTSVFVVNQMGLDRTIRSDLVFKVYEGGHMFYTHATAREQLFRDIQEFFQGAVR